MTAPTQQVDIVAAGIGHPDMGTIKLIACGLRTSAKVPGTMLLLALSLVTVLPTS